METIEAYLEEHDVEGRINHDVYAEYTRFCSEHDLKALGFRTFAIKLSKCFGYRTVQKCTRAGMVRIIEKDSGDDRIGDYIGERGSEMFDEMEPKEAYSQYSEICEREGVKPLGRIEFTRRMCATMKLETKSVYRDGEYVRVFKYKE